MPNLDFTDDSQEPQHLFNQFYDIAYSLLDQFYPILSITVFPQILPTAAFPFFLIQVSLYGFPRLFTVTSEHIH